jgi:hypothetical protein
MPYAPGISYDGDKYLFQGITSAGDSMAAAIEKAGQQHQLLRSYQSMGKALGWDPKEMAKMTPADFEGRLKAIGVQHTMDDMGLNDLQKQQLQQTIAQHTQQAQAGKAFQSALAKFAGGRDIYNNATAGAGGGIPGNTPPPVPPMPGGMDIFNMGVGSGMDPEKAATIAQTLQRVQQQQTGKSPNDFAFDPAGVRDIPGVGKFIPTSKGGGQVVESPEAIQAKAEAQASAKPVPSGIKFKAIPSLTDPTGYATSVEADTPEGLQQGMALLKQNAGGGAPAPAATPRTFTDKSGTRWNYKGAMANPTKDTNPQNWVPMSATQ